jgi:hypothetical protein
VRPFSATSKIVGSGTAPVIATIDELDLQDVVPLALLSKEGVDHGAPIPLHVVDPVLVDQLFQWDVFALSVEALERPARFARRRLGNGEAPPGEALVRDVLAGQIGQRNQKL